MIPKDQILPFVKFQSCGKLGQQARKGAEKRKTTTTQLFISWNKSDFLVVLAMFQLWKVFHSTDLISVHRQWLVLLTVIRPLRWIYRKTASDSTFFRLFCEIDSWRWHFDFCPSPFLFAGIYMRSLWRQFGTSLFTSGQTRLLDSRLEGLKFSDSVSKLITGFRELYTRG